MQAAKGARCVRETFPSVKKTLEELLFQVLRLRSLGKAEREYIQQSFDQLKQSYFALVLQYPDSDRAACERVEEQAEIEAVNVNHNYCLCLLIETGDGPIRSKRKREAIEQCIAYKLAMAVHYENQLKQLCALHEIPMTAEFLQALTRLDRKLAQVKLSPAGAGEIPEQRYSPPGKSTAN